MTTKKDDKLVSKPKSAIKTKTTKTKPLIKDVKKDSSLLIKAAETVGGILGRVAGTAHNMTAGKKASTPTNETIEEVIPKELTAKTPAKLSAKPESKPKAPTKPKTTKAKK